jgi:hypothetical protein
MLYKFYTDRDELFECNVNIKNASTKNSIARLIIETPDVSLIFEGKIEKDKCIVPVKKLRGLIDEGTIGGAKLEIILEDTYFKPWQSQCIIEKHTKVEINEVKNTIINKPLVEVVVKSQTQPSKEKLYKNGLFELKYVFSKLNIKTKKDIIQILNEFFNNSPDYIGFKRELIKEVFKGKIL